jgi:uncharacterized protein (DUF427 family)
MQLEAIFQDGRLKFVKPVRFVTRHFRVKVEVPDDVLADAAESVLKEPVPECADEWLSRLESIKQEILAVPEGELPALSEKQSVYASAYALRDDR